MSRAWAAAALAAHVGLVAAGCTADRAIYDARLPSTSTPAAVTWLAERAGYLDLAVETAGESLRFFAPAADEACAQLAADPRDVRYQHHGHLGRLVAGDVVCELVGVLSLEAWRDRRARGSREPVPRSRATFRVVHRDADVTLARGRFGLAGELGWVGGADTVAVFARSDRCDALLDEGVASLEYRHEGPDVLALLASDGRCPLLGIARPLGAR